MFLARIFTSIVLLGLLSVQQATADVIAAIEVGSKGVKVRVLDLNRTLSGSVNEGTAEYIVLAKSSENVNIIDDQKDDFLSPEGIERGARAVERLMNDLRKYDPLFIIVVTSTSFDRYKNKTALELKIQQLTKVEVVPSITGDEEIFYALRTSIRPALEPFSLLLDIGSGNTKIGYHSKISSRRFEQFTINYGTARLASKAKEKAKELGIDYSSAVTKIIDDEVRPRIRKEMLAASGYANERRRIYMEGGTPWAVASFAKPIEIEKPYTYLSFSDVKRVAQKFSTGDFSNSQVPAYADVVLSNVLDVFPPDKQELHAGSALLVAFLEEIKVGRRQIIFNREGGWIIGYLITKYEEFRSKTPR
jgi:hypothetical protein